ncbi:hypothetical protein ASD48_22320 [Streptomyces sp. Root1310]|nr:hypothetical protein ASD48_22320 [Streptomyces sp. Root1310]
MRVYGAAVPAPGEDDPFADVAAVRIETKDALAVRCADLVRDDETVLFDIGTHHGPPGGTPLHGRPRAGPVGPPISPLPSGPPARP